MRTLLILIVVVLASPCFGRPPVFATPDQADLVRGARSLQDGFETDAYDKFLRAAELGNKEAQKSIGLMYIKGIGVEKDWASAYAWLKLAGNHGDPKIIAARDEVWGTLREDEKAAANQRYEQIKEHYGDYVALKRRQEWVRKQKREVTGSRTGRVGALRIQVADATGYNWELSGVEYYNVLDQYIVELKQHLGEVELRDFELLEDDDD